MLREHAAALWHVTRTGARVVATHGSDAAGRAAFAHTLRPARGEAVQLLADLHGERFALDSIPRLRGRERHALLARRLGQRFAGPGFYHSRGLGRTKEGREALFLACLRLELLQPWLAVPEAAGVCLAGACSLPLLLPLLPPLFSVRFPRRPRREIKECLFLNLSEGGARISYLLDGCVLFSHSVEAPHDAVGNNATWDSDARQDLQWLGGALEADLRRLPEEARRKRDAEPLQLLLLAPAASSKALHALDMEALGLRPRWLDPEWAARRMGLRGSGVTPDSLLVRCLAQRPRLNHYAPLELPRTWRLRQRKRMLRAAACACLPLGLAGAALLSGTGLQLKRERHALLASGVFASPPEPVARAPDPEFSPPWEKLSHGPDSGSLLRRLEAALRRAPELSLQEVRWSLPTIPEVIGPKGIGPNVTESRGGGPVEGQPASLAFELHVRALLTAFEPRRQLEVWQRLEATLGKLFPGTLVQALEWPVPPEPGAALEGRLGGNSPAATTQVLFLVRRP